MVAQQSRYLNCSLYLRINDASGNTLYNDIRYMIVSLLSIYFPYIKRIVGYMSLVKTNFIAVILFRFYIC